ncbi:hypothetical protein N7465_000074 [Penicillium sp. CMV-2018d]|nr:hypothetical protein N7465_000074 [Penicillium sp. CMV-2018d]
MSPVLTQNARKSHPKHRRSGKEHRERIQHVANGRVRFGHQHDPHRNLAVPYTRVSVMREGQVQWPSREMRR